MDTPTSTRRLRHTRSLTPRISDRKKNLFEITPTKDLEGIEFLDTGKNDHEMVESVGRTTRHNIVRIFETKSLCNEKNEMKTPIRCSPRSTRYTQILRNRNGSGKENNPEIVVDDIANEQFQKMFINSMKLDSEQLKCDYEKLQEALPADEFREPGWKSCPDSKKRPNEVHENLSVSPQTKFLKITEPEIFTPIPTKQFYSCSLDKSSIISMNENNSYNASSMTNINLNSCGTSPKTRLKPRRAVKASINRGVKHKIRRSRVPCIGAVNNHQLLSVVDVALILKNVRNEKLRKIIDSKREERNQIEKLHNILRTSKDPITMARPLSSICRLDNCDNNNEENTKNVNNLIENHEADFSDIEYSSEEDANTFDSSMYDGIIPLISHKESNETVISTPCNRKFFKSNRSNQTPKEITITENIKASLCNGKISLVQDDKKNKRKHRRRTYVMNEFSDEQATVDAILEKLNNSTLVEATNTFKANEVEVELQNMVTVTENEQIKSTNEIQSPSSKFRNRIPYKTNDKSKIEQQHLLLDFLINNNLCTEENFTIFIADPDNHKDEAARIVDQVFVLVNEQDGVCELNTSPQDDHHPVIFAMERTCSNEELCDDFIRNDGKTTSIKNTDTLVEKCVNQLHNNFEVNSSTLKHNENAPESTIFKDITSNQHTTDTLRENFGNEKRSESDNLFSIFYKNHWKPLRQESKRILPHIWNGGQGTTQYQIDAGQRIFGAQQCKQCGLVYSVHEPEEEKLHREYHSSLHILRFKGWIDEDIVAIYPEWGSDGRILRVTENSNVRKYERLVDVLKIVDQELGFSSYVIPQTFVAYLAVRKGQIVGLCLVQPLKKAHKYISINGIDCYSEEEFSTKCGISRIWVSPLHRRLHIASKLMQVVQQNTVFGEEIPLNKIAFSAPTECGKLFAQKITLSENFLVYQ